MKKQKQHIGLIFIPLFISLAVHSQQPEIQNYRPNNKDGLTIFEAPKTDTVPFEGLKVRLGGDLAMQFQSIEQRNTLDNLVDMGNNFNLPSANLNLDVQLLNGVRMHLRTYLSSRHHYEAWIKGGYLQIDNLDFVSSGFLDGFMKHTTITIGMDEFNYGDAHFRRSDNARAIFNPFVGNYLMDGFSTEAFGEITWQYKGFLAVGGATNGKLNQSVVINDASDNQPSFYGKLGYDSQLNEDLRLRLTGSFYTNHGTTTGTWLYGGDRAGSRYYNVLHTIPNEMGTTEGGNFDGRFNPRFRKLTAFQVNPFIKFKGFELFGIYELANGNDKIYQPQPDREGAYTQLAAELIFRFGKDEKFYLSTRYNTINGKMRESHEENQQIDRLNIGGGWFISKNILTKIEYVDQRYIGNAWAGRFDGASFRGVMFEAVISF